MKALRTWIILLALTVIPTFQANAFKRATLPTNIAIAQADVIVEARVAAVNPTSDGLESANIKVSRVLKGTLSEKELKVQLRDTAWKMLERIKVGEHRILFLKLEGSGGYAVLYDGTTLYGEERALSLQDAIAQSPPWSEVRPGLSSVITANKFRLKKDEDLDVIVGYKNTSSSDVTLAYSDWPLVTHTYWALDIKSPKGKAIMPKPHPFLNQKDINDYFAKSPKSYEVVIKPGEDYFFILDRVNSAKPGWGYKEILDFKYYPLNEPGKYTISAKAIHLLKNLQPVAAGLTIWIE